MGWVLLFLVIAIAAGVWAKLRLRDLEDPLRERSPEDDLHRSKTLGIFWRGSGPGF